MKKTYISEITQRSTPAAAGLDDLAVEIGKSMGAQMQQAERFHFEPVPAQGGKTRQEHPGMLGDHGKITAGPGHGKAALHEHGKKIIPTVRILPSGKLLQVGAQIRQCLIRRIGDHHIVRAGEQAERFEAVPQLLPSPLRVLQILRRLPCCRFRDLIQGTPLSAMKQEMIKAVFHTHDRLPPEWEHVNGRILNRCFVDYAAVEQLFGSSVTYFDRIRKYDLESVVQMNHGLAESIRFTDQEMQEKILSLCQNEYHVASHNQLDAKTLLILARALARRFSCPKTQIGRLLGLSGDVLDRLL